MVFARVSDVLLAVCKGFLFQWRSWWLDWLAGWVLMREYVVQPSYINLFLLIIEGIEGHCCGGWGLICELLYSIIYSWLLRGSVVRLSWWMGANVGVCHPSYIIILRDSVVRLSWWSYIINSCWLYTCVGGGYLVELCERHCCWRTFHHTHHHHHTSTHTHLLIFTSNTKHCFI